MANPTTNFGWVMPTSTSLVTNLPADFNTFGQGVDTSMAQLKGGTTGQILSKTSATDMAFTWITPNPGDITAVTAGTGISGGGTSGDVTITNSIATAMTTKGDLVPATGSGTFSRLAIGTNGQVLTADSTAATGMKWNTGLASPLTTKGDLWTYSTTDARLAVGTNGQTLVADSTAATGLAWKSSSYTAKTAAYTFAAGDEGNIFSMNNATTQQFNIPTDATYNFAVGTEITVFWITGAGQPTIGAVTPGTTTLISTGATSATPKLRVANSGATLKKLAANSWIVFGDIA